MPSRDLIHESLLDAIATVGLLLEIMGVVIVILGAVGATGYFLVHLWTWGDRLQAYGAYRANFARAVLLGLEFLVAGDIIRTVVVEPTLVNVGSLAVVVLVRTFLSITLEMEVSGRWPWNRPDHQPDRNV